MTRFLTAIVIAIVLVFGAIFFLLENPTRFKSQIAQIAQQATGYQVDIKGDLTWRYWPPIAIRAEQLTLSANAGVFAEFERIEADVDLIPLLTGQRALNVDRIAMSGGKIDIKINHQGIDNWTPSNTAATSTPGEITAPEKTLIPSLQALEIADVSIRYENQQTAVTYRAQLENLNTGPVKANTAFDTSASITLFDEASDTQIKISTSGRLWVNDDGIRAGFDELATTIAARIDGKVWPNATVISQGEWRADTSTITLNQFNLQTQYLQGAFSGLVNLSGEQPRAAGTLHIESAAPGQFSELVGLELPISFLSLDTDVAATPETLSFKSFDGRFDESAIKGSLDYRDGDIPLLRAEIRIDQLNLDEAVTEESAGDAIAASGSGTSTETELIPVEALQDIELTIIARIEQLTMEGYDFSAAKVELNSRNARLETIANAGVFDGKVVLVTSTALDPPVTTNLQISMDQFDVTQLTQWESLTGNLTGTSSLDFTGTLLSDLQTSVTGTTRFNIKQGELDVRAVKNLAQTIDTIRGKRSYISDWPDRMPFDNMNGQLLTSNGFVNGQLLSARVDNLSIAAIGGFDLDNETMAWDVTAMFEQTDTGNFKVSKQLSGIRWPMACEGSIDAAPADLCFGRDGAISALVSDIVKQDLNRRGAEKIDEIIDDKVPEKFKEITRDIFKDIFKRP